MVSRALLKSQLEKQAIPSVSTSLSTDLRHIQRAILSDSDSCMEVFQQILPEVHGTTSEILSRMEENEQRIIDMVRKLIMAGDFIVALT